jgi:hypothetical protein
MSTDKKRLRLFELNGVLAFASVALRGIVFEKRHGSPGQSQTHKKSTYHACDS